MGQQFHLGSSRWALVVDAVGGVVVLDPPFNDGLK